MTLPIQRLTSWGRVMSSEEAVYHPSSRFDPLPDETRTFLPYGKGRSYGDSCLNPGGVAIKTGALDRYIRFDPVSGVLACEAGVSFDEILRLVVPQGWFLPVTPGTRFITLGGAIANDVHGKNHHVAGTFGVHVRNFELLRSDGQRLLCSRELNPEMFAATVGGLGLTGLVTWAEIQLRRIHNPWINTETIRYGSVAEFFELCELSDRDYEYTVAWVDCVGTGQRLGRGLFTRGNHAPAGTNAGRHSAKAHTFPFVPPVSVVNAWTLQAFNSVYYHKQLRRSARQVQHYEPFFYPLDGMLEWNRMYGPRGFYQYQCVLPKAHGQAAITEMLDAVAHSGMGSFLAVLKMCGAITSPGVLSFPLPGVSLALDFPNQGERLQQLFTRLDDIVRAAQGRLYPAKDACMPGELFRAGYPQWQHFAGFVDPGFSSSFWRRVMEDK